MKGIAWALAAVVLASPAWADAPNAPQAHTRAEDTRLGRHPELTRLVLDVSEIADFRTLVTDKGRRILVGFPSVDWEANRHRLQPFGPITRFDFMRRGLKRGLLVIHTSRSMRVEHQFTLPPDAKAHKGNRLVLDLVDAGHQGKVPAPR
ncbi:MAG: hypothetical protein ACM3Q1_04680 [Bacteroidales bacterium]